MYKTRTLVESCVRLDVRAMSRAGCLEGGQGNYYPSPGVAIGFVCGDGAITITHTHTLTGRQMEQALRIERTACFGALSRPWFLCPCCGRRAAVLFDVAEHGFVCRGCGGVAYQSQRLDATARSWRTEAAIERRLGPHRTRRRYMHSATYERLLDALDRSKRRRDAELIEWASKRYRRLP